MITSIIKTYILFGLRTVIPIVVLPFLSHLVGIEGVGIILSSQALGLVGGLLIQFGFHQSASRDLGVAVDAKQVAGVVTRVLGAQFFIAVAACVVIGLAAYSTPILNGVDGGVGATVALAVGTGLSPAWYFRGTRRPETGVLVEMAGQILSLSLIIGVVGSPRDVWLALWFTAAGPLASSVAGVVWVILEAKPERTLRWVDIFRVAKSSFPLFLVRVSSTGFTMSAAWIASLLTSPRETAYFGVAAKIASALTTFSQPVLFALLPAISRLATESRSAALRVAVRWGAALLALAICAVIGVHLFADDFVGILFAKDMAPAADVTRALVWICVLAALRDTLGDLVLVPLRRDKVVAYCVVFGSISGLSSAFLFAPQGGACGMVHARLLGEAVVVCLMALSVLRILRVH